MEKDIAIKKIQDGYKLNSKVAEEIYKEANSRLELFKTQGVTDEKELQKRFGVILSSMLIKRLKYIEKMKEEENKKKIAEIIKSTPDDEILVLDV